MGVDISKFDVNQLFGMAAAEDDDDDVLKEYFLKNEYYEAISGNMKLYILEGYKGTGKSAMLKMSYLHLKSDNKLCLWIRPDDFPNVNMQSDNNSDLIIAWKKDLKNLIVQHAYAEYLHEDSPENKIFNVINSVNQMFNVAKRADVNEDEVAKKIADNFRLNKEVYVFIDDLDRVWKGDINSIHRISSLVSALRDLSGSERGLKFRISLRADMYTVLQYDDSNLDKVSQNIIDIRWTRNDLLKVLVLRVQHYLWSHGYVQHQVKSDDLLKKSQSELEKMLEPVMELTFNGRGKWSGRPIHNVLLSLVRERPRDLIFICILAAKRAKSKQHKKINTSDWEDIFIEYSRARLRDTIAEHKDELGKDGVRDFLNSMKTTREESKRGANLFTKEAILTKIKGVLQQNDIRYINSSHELTPKEGLKFLYKIGFVVARKDASFNGYITRVTYSENSDLIDQDAGYQFEIHPAFRWALNFDPSKDPLQQIEDENN